MLSHPNINSAMGANVLVADDDPIFLSLMTRRLELIGATPLSVDNGLAAWNMLAHNPVDLALIDLDMPGLKGTELIQCVRGHPRTLHIPIVVITSRSDGAAISDALSVGATAFLTKPLNWSMLGGYVSFLLNLTTGARRAVAELNELHKAMAAKRAEHRVELEALSARITRIAGNISIPAQAAGDLTALSEALLSLAGRDEAIRSTLPDVREPRVPYAPARRSAI